MTRTIDLTNLPDRFKQKIIRDRFYVKKIEGVRYLLIEDPLLLGDLPFDSISLGFNSNNIEDIIIEDVIKSQFKDCIGIKLPEELDIETDELDAKLDKLIIHKDEDVEVIRFPYKDS